MAIGVRGGSVWARRPTSRMRWLPHALMHALLLAPAIARRSAGNDRASLQTTLDKMNEDNSACSACNLVTKTLDAEALSSHVVKEWKDASSVQRAKLLRQGLKKSCKRLATMEIGIVAQSGSRTYFDQFDMKKQGMMGMFEGSQTGDDVSGAVAGLCELLVTAKATTLVAHIEKWMSATKGRRLVDFRFQSPDLAMCAGGVIDACKNVSTNKSAASSSGGGSDDDDDDDDDDREL